jgi:lipopolysaccharide/colanic/teichoic acid biosynthesis glycosyltransferase
MMAHSTPLTKDTALSYLLDERLDGVSHVSNPPLAPDMTDYLEQMTGPGSWEGITQTALLNCQLPQTPRHLYLEGPLVKAHNPGLLFSNIRKSLAEGQIFAFRIATAENIKASIQQEYSRLFIQLYYPFHYMGRRVLPKLKGLRKLSRLLNIPVDMSKSEVMGRLIYHGLEIMHIHETPRETIFVARRHASSNPSETAPLPSEGLLFTMRRVGKNGQPIKVYKFRSMHPYAEYAQEYVHKVQGLDEGGKFKDDFRVSTGGRLIRKYWIDEIPMLFNLLKGDIKLIGVRPISEHYFGLYPPEVRAVRTRHKPGLLPPFYADLPKTLDEIVASELNYLEAYERAPLKTDLIYLKRIVKNILLNKARSK